MASHDGYFVDREGYVLVAPCVVAPGQAVVMRLPEILPGVAGLVVLEADGERTSVAQVAIKVQYGERVT